MAEPEETRELAKQVAIEVGAVGLGLAIAGPAGALIAGAVKPIVELIAIRERRGLRNAELLATAAMEAAGLSAEFTVWASADDGRTMLFTSALEAGFNTILQNKVAALAGVIRNNLGDDTKLDLGILVIAALNDLEAPHIHVLSAMINEPPVRLTTEAFAEGAWPLSGLQAKFPGLAPGIRSIMAALERHGIAFGGGMAATAPGGGADQMWSATDFGKLCYECLAESPTAGRMTP